MKLNTKAFALACGIVWGLGLFFLTWWIIAFDGATGEATLIGRLYRGYTISAVGSLIGLIWGFFDARITSYNVCYTKLLRPCISSNIGVEKILLRTGFFSSCSR